MPSEQGLHAFLITSPFPTYTYVPNMVGVQEILRNWNLFQTYSRLYLLQELLVCIQWLTHPLQIKSFSFEFTERQFTSGINTALPRAASDTFIFELAHKSLV